MNEEEERIDFYKGLSASARIVRHSMNGGLKMQDEFRIIEQSIVSGKKKLLFHAEGKVTHQITNNKLRVVIVFQCGKKQRRFPVETTCFTQGGETYFSIREEIWLEYVFYPFTQEDAGKIVQIFFEYCDTHGDWYVLPNKSTLEGNYFLAGQKKRSCFYNVYCRVLYVLSFLFLPLLLLDGYFAVKGYKKSPYIRKETAGKRGMFYHAHGMVKSLTGYGYSMREFKTNYFAKKYSRACRREKDPEGILFLSERACERGGNLDLIRQGAIDRKIFWRECIDTRPVHQLPLSVIRRVAKMAAQAKVIVLEDFYPQLHAVTLRPETQLIQLWHACGAFKMFGLSELGKVDYLSQDTKNHRNYTVAITSGTRMIPFYSEAFGISAENVQPLGVPRTDIFFDEAYGEKIKEEFYNKYPSVRGKKVVLFAPTFRGSGNKTAYYPMERFIVGSFLDAMPDNVVLIIKNHPFVREHFSYDQDRYGDRVLDLTGKENINDILFLTSLLITDYSSCIFEASLLRIPMLFYVFDLEEYVSQRDFYFDFSTFAPGEKVRTFDDVMKMSVRLLADGKGAEKEQEANFREYFLDSLDGHSTERVLQLIQKFLEMG